MRKAIGYVRVSTGKQADFGCSIAIQIEKIRKYCKDRGLDLVDILVEKGGVSAYKKRLPQRIQGNALVRILGSGDIKDVVIIKLDRMFRSAADAILHEEKWSAQDVSIHLIDQGGQSIETTTAVGKFMYGQLALQAEFERNMTAERTKNAAEYKKEHGQRWGQIPYGKQVDEYSGRIVDCDYEIQQIEVMRTNRKDGDSLRTIAGYMNRSGIPSKSGGRWSHQSVSSVLQGVEG